MARAGLLAAAVVALITAAWWWTRGDRTPTRDAAAAPGVASVVVAASPTVPAAAITPAPAVGNPRATSPVVSPGGNPIASAIAAARHSSSTADAVAAAVWLARCESTRNTGEERVRSMAEMRVSGPGADERIKTVAGQAVAAHRALVGACAALDDPALAAQGEALRQRTNTQANSWAPLAGLSRKQAGESWPAAQYQAAVVALGDPSHNPAAVESVLRLLPAVPPAAGGSALNSYEAEVARVLARQELTGDRDPTSVSNASACAQRSVCEVQTAAFAQAAENRRIVAAAQHLVQLIRTQQWAAIGLRP